jgi:hypothetical protein
LDGDEATILRMFGNRDTRLGTKTAVTVTTVSKQDSDMALMQQHWKDAMDHIQDLQTQLAVFRPLQTLFENLQTQFAAFQPMPSQIEALQLQIVAFQPLQSEMSILKAQVSAVESKVELLETPPPKPPRLYIHQVLLSMGYQVSSDACLSVGFQAYLLACERGKEIPKDAWGRVYYETDRELLEDAVRMVPDLKKKDS